MTKTLTTRRPARKLTMWCFLGLLLAAASCAVVLSVSSASSASAQELTLGSPLTCRVNNAYLVDPGNWVDFRRIDVNGNGRLDTILLIGEHANFFISDRNENGTYETLFRPVNSGSWMIHVDFNEDGYLEWTKDSCGNWQYLSTNAEHIGNKLLGWANQLR